VTGSFSLTQAGDPNNFGICDVTGGGTTENAQIIASVLSYRATLPGGFVDTGSGADNFNASTTAGSGGSSPQYRKWFFSSAGVTAPPAPGTCSWRKADTGDTSSTFYNVFALDASHLYATGVGGPSGHSPLWATADAGVTWRDIAPPGQVGQHFGIDFLDVDHGIVAGARGIWRTADGGSTWSHATPAPPPDSEPLNWSWNDVAYVDASHIWAVGSAGSNIGAVIFSGDAGATWTAQTSPTEVGLFGVDFVDATHGWAVGWGGVILATSDGSTWQTQRPSANAPSLYDVDFVDTAHGWASEEGGLVWATTDGGATWLGQPSGYDSGLPGVGAATPRDAMVVTNDGHIRRTTDGGVTWADTPTGVDVLFLGDIAMPDATHAIAAGYAGTILLGTCTQPPEEPGGTADLGLTKEGPVTANAGEELTYTLKVKNNGPDVATNVTVNDTLPAGLELVSAAPAPPACVGTVTVVCNLGTLQVGQTGVATLVARAVQAGPVHNDASASSDQSDPTPGDNTGGWNTSVGPPPQVSVHKGVAVVSGPRLRYTIDVENLGPTTAYGVVAKDILDPGWTLLDVDTTQGVCDARVVCSIGTLAVGDKATVTIEIGIVTFEPVHNEVTATWYGGGVTTAGSTSPGLPFLVVSKAHQGDFFAGGIGTYTVTASNIGAGPTTADIVVTDHLPAGMTFASSSGGGFTCGAEGSTVTCTRSTPLAAGASASFTLTVHIGADAPRQPTNFIEIGGGGGFAGTEPAIDSGTIVDPPVLGVQKSVKERVVRIGHNFTYLIDVTNTGARAATNVQVIDTIPASVDLVSITPGAPTCSGTRTITCNVGDLPVGQTVTVEIVVKPREITLLTNEAFASGDGLLPVPSGQTTTQVFPEAAHLNVEKTADQPVVIENSTLRYTILAKNLGPGDTTNVKINDPLPAGVKLVSIQPDPTYGMTCNVDTPPAPIALDHPVICTIPVLPELTTSKVVITVQVLRVGSLGNTATASSDDTPATETASGTATVLVAAPSVSLVATTNGTDGALVRVGDPVTWGYQVTNTGDVDLTNVRVTDNKLAATAIHCAGGTNVVASLAAGATVDCTATGTAASGAYSNIGTVTGTPPAGNDVTASDPSSYFGAAPSLSIATTTNGGDGSRVWVGDAITWSYHVTNTGNVDLTNVRVTENKLAPTAIHCAGGTNVVASLAAGAVVDCIATGTATSGAYSNIGTVTGAPPAGNDVTASDPSSYTAFTTGLTAPTATTCQQFAAHTSGTLTEEAYNVSKGKIGSIAPGVFFYYSKIVVSGATTFAVQQSNTAGWKIVSVQQAVLWNGNCAKTAVTPKTDATTGRTTFDTTGLNPGTYYTSIKYDPGSIVGTTVAAPYPAVPYTFGTYLNTSLYQSSNQVVTMKAKP
jgi:uncharacterized repeat protein (TIGR01451 family)